MLHPAHVQQLIGICTDICEDKQMYWKKEQIQYSIVSLRAITYKKSCVRVASFIKRMSVK